MSRAGSGKVTTWLVWQPDQVRGRASSPLALSPEGLAGRDLGPEDHGGVGDEGVAGPGRDVVQDASLRHALQGHPAGAPGTERVAIKPCRELS